MGTRFNGAGAPLYKTDGSVVAGTETPAMLEFRAKVRAACAVRPVWPADPLRAFREAKEEMENWKRRQKPKRAWAMPEEDDPAIVEYEDHDQETDIGFWTRWAARMSPEDQAETARELAEEYGITADEVLRILNGKGEER
jgi:hypothetical protein